MQRHTSFAEIGGFLVTFRALRNAFLASKYTISRRRLPAGIEPPGWRRYVENWTAPKLAH